MKQMMDSKRFKSPSSSEEEFKRFSTSTSTSLGLDLSVRSEAWKFLTGYYPWKSSYDERLTTDSVRRKSYESLCNMYTKIEPLLETEHRDFTEVQNFIPIL
ncbi:hypothetical protein E2320_013344 [Naja naja]|nr:hypothetical protein E2320_013344 [Naja naja]